MSKPEAKPEDNSGSNTNNNLNVNPPLPCRGCTESCPNKLHCNGKPWRPAANNFRA